MEHLTALQSELKQAAKKYCTESHTNFYKSIENSFKAGAEWQKDRLLGVLKAIAAWPGNLPDCRLNTATGPNDAAMRGNIVITMRQIAIDAINKFEPDYKPFKD